MDAADSADSMRTWRGTSTTGGTGSILRKKDVFSTSTKRAAGEIKSKCLASMNFFQSLRGADRKTQNPNNSYGQNTGVDFVQMMGLWSDMVNSGTRMGLES